MAGKNITIAGAVFNAVPSIDVPISGGGTASFVEISDTTAAAADVASGKYFYTAAGVKTEGTASGGGGASNIVTGTFKGTTTGAAMDVTLNYGGTGYPIAVIVYPKGGVAGNSAFNNLIQRYAIGIYCIIKRDTSLAPSYSNDSTYDLADVLYMYKSNASNAAAYSWAGNSNNSGPYYDGDATSLSGQRLRMRSAKKMSVFIASTSYGFAANIEYTYHVIYSS